MCNPEQITVTDCVQGMKKRIKGNSSFKTNEKLHREYPQKLILCP